MMEEKRPIYRPFRQVNPETGRCYATPMQAATLEHLVKRWLETHSPSFMFDALEYCDANDVPVLPLLRKHLADACKHQRKGARTKAMSEGKLDLALMSMANLIIHGSLLSEAAGKVAAYLGGEWKASTLETYYTRQYRTGKESLENILRTAWAEDPDPELSAQWEVIRDQLRAPTDEEKGNRRL